MPPLLVSCPVFCTATLHLSVGSARPFLANPLADITLCNVNNSERQAVVRMGASWWLGAGASFFWLQNCAVTVAAAQKAVALIGTTLQFISAISVFFFSRYSMGFILLDSLPIAHLRAFRRRLSVEGPRLHGSDTTTVILQ